MKNKFILIWKDPVWSKLIASLILAILALIYNATKAYYEETDLISELKKFSLIKINLWIAISIALICFLISNYWNKKKSIKSFQYDSETIELDRKLFQKIKTELFSKETLDDLYTHTFSNHAFEKEKFNFIYNTIKANEDPEFEFLNPELEHAKNELVEAVKKFQTATFGTIYSAPSHNDIGYLGIPREWDQKKFYAAMDKIEPEETNVFIKAESLIKKGRRILKI